MRFVRFEAGGAAAWGLVEGETIAPLEGAPWAPGGPKRTGAPLDRRAARLLAAAAPSKILCIGRNYRAHAAGARQRGPEGAARLLQAARPP